MCEFCKIINRQQPAYIVYEDKKLISFLDIEPANEGHVLVVPKEHTDSIDKLPEYTLMDIMAVLRKIVIIFRKIYGNDGYSIMQNGGKCCDFGHIHFHVFPRYENDGFGFIYPEGNFEYSAAVAEKLRKEIEDLTENN